MTKRKRIKPEIYLFTEQNDKATCIGIGGRYNNSTTYHFMINGLHYVAFLLDSGGEDEIHH